MSIPRRSSQGVPRAHFRYPEFRGRLRQIIGTDQPFAWAKRVGISKGAFTRIWKQGTIPTAQLLFRIKQATGVSLDWLLTGDGRPGGGEAARGHDDRLIPLPVLTLGRGGPRLDGGFLALRRDFAARHLGTDPGQLAILWVRGDAMSPTLEDGDMGLIDRRQRSIAQEGLYALRQDGTLRIVRVQRISRGRFQASSDNPRYKPFVFTARNRVSIVGRVVCAGKLV